ncbi:MAG: M20/M25/M40 family metallo-hydrolase [Actinobacteria bacterium]|nr:M20/M25/M40 family metallo-hydrolase [Actinomycetota bacterium]
MSADDGGLVDEVTDLLQRLIQAGCVNDGTEGSGQESRAVDILRPYLEGSGLEIETYEPRPGRQSLIARIEGTDRDAPSLMLMGHTDVVPADAQRWDRDPFGGELVDGVVWGRGAVDMLNLTASMAVAVRRLADRGFTPRGDLVYLAVAATALPYAMGTGGSGGGRTSDVTARLVQSSAGRLLLLAIGAAVLVVAVGAFTVSRTLALSEFDADLTFRSQSNASLERVLETPPVASRLDAGCGPLTTPTHKLVPDVRWILDLPPDRVVARSDPAGTGRYERGVSVLVHGRAAVFSQALPDESSEVRHNLPLPGYERVATSAYYGAYVNC